MHSEVSLNITILFGLEENKGYFFFLYIMRHPRVFITVMFSPCSSNASRRVKQVGVVSVNVVILSSVMTSPSVYFLESTGVHFTGLYCRYIIVLHYGTLC